REVFPGLEEIRIWNRTPEKAAQLATEWQAQGIPVRAVTDLAATVAESDIVSTATMAVAPFLQGDWLRPGTHVDLIGAYRPDMREADDAVLARGELFVDSRRTTIGHIGEIEILLQQG